ncbi:M-phase phosphoprotein 10 [Klebsormidium nitens]|uniref:U3 small nucleolar ribonucleoprotein protein MPP10 n=1 Tax=Klebsormidium nitens TaxID=105231 RepID=A0A1Y1I1M0_KLENI|nr:M-phase phosphoprotein 10 [Klebsormidium nitens]|eukprot:GAQ82657.1 M-phase phosphoprotein 10 [Klebsormidium nitens]
MGVPVMAPGAPGGKALMTTAVAALGQETLEPTAFLAPSADLASTVRSAAKDLFDFTAAYLTSAKDGLLNGKVALPELHSEGFDAEQIWLQLEMQSQPVLAKLKKRIRKVVRRAEGEGTEALLSVPDEKLGDEVAEGNGLDEEEELGTGSESGGEGGPRFDSDDFDEEDFEDDEEGEGLDDRRESGGKAGVSGKKGQQPVEDEFLSLGDMEKFLQDAEERGQRDDGQEDEEEDAEGDEGSEEEGIKYEEFYGKRDGGRRKESKRRDKREEDDWGGEAFSDDEELDDGMDDEGPGLEEDEEGDEELEVGGAEGLSAHERRLARTRERIAQLEKANVEEKSWTMVGEATAGKRPLNSALEVDLDFEHAQRPAPVITEEVTASLEDIIKKRIIEGQFDDVVRKAAPATGAPRRREELDDSKSQKGLAEIYEEEYVKATAGPDAIAAATGDDVVKREAAMLFKSLCLKLDALSHFTFAPKPVIEDASVRADVPALAMEEVAPLAVSDANLLAPEEVFAGGDGRAGVRGKAAGAVKAEGELTQEERRSKRAKCKRKRKAEMSEVEKAKRTKLAAKAGGASNSEIAAAFAAKTATKPGKTKAKNKDDGQAKPAFTKSAQVFARIQEAQEEAAANKGQKRGKALDADDQKGKKQSFKL